MQGNGCNDRPSGASRFRVAVFSCGALGIDIANRLQGLPQVADVLLVLAPWRQPRRSLAGKLRHVYRHQGLAGLLSVAAAKLGLSRRPAAVTSALALDARVQRFDTPDFHGDDCLAAVRDWRPDLGVVAGTYILRDSLFALPRLGSVNLHSGKVPEYRGAAPAFWELFNGEREVGVTVHRVESALDAGVVYRQELFPLDPAPAGDPLCYLERYRHDVLRPAGIRLLAETVAALAQGAARGVPQDAGRARTYRTPTYADIRELRRRVAARRLEQDRKPLPCGKSA